MALDHVRTWQFQPVQVNPNGAGTNYIRDCSRLHMAAVANGFLGRGTWYDKTGATVASAGNWTVWGSSDGTSFSNAGTNYWDTGGVITVGNLNWAAGAHSWIVFQQTGIAAKYQVCIDLNSANTYQATVVVSFGAGFGLANGGTDGTASARPTATDQQILISTTDWGAHSGGYGSILNCAKTSDGSAFRFWAFRQDACIQFYLFEVPDPVVNNWTSPSIAHAIGQSTITEQLTYVRLYGLNSYSKTPGGTIFTSRLGYEGNQSVGNVPSNQGHINDVDGTAAFRQIPMWSETVNARNVNGLLTDTYWGAETGQVLTGSLNGQVAKSSGSVRWTRVGALWMPWLDGTSPRTSL